MNDAVLERTNCLNCGKALAGTYCSRCGQKDAPANPTFRDLIQDLARELLNLDGKTFRSTWLLLTRPGLLTREYFAGRKARYLAPLRLYLVFSVCFFGLSALAGPDPIFESDEEVEVGALGRIFGLENMSPAEANERVTRATSEWMPRAMFVLVPVCALLVAIVTKGTRRNYPQHLWFALHVHGAYFAILAITLLLDLLRADTLSSVVSTLRTLFIIGYAVVAFRTAYGGRWRLAAGRAAFVLVTYPLIVIVAIAGVMIAAASI
jgi:Protein of unknown function (DUF3667)